MAAEKSSANGYAPTPPLATAFFSSRSATLDIILALRLTIIPASLHGKSLLLFKTARPGYPELIARLKPDWLILRPLEIERQGITNADMRTNYRVAKVIDHTRELKAIPFLPGRGWLEYDSQFVVFQRVHDAHPEAKVSLR